MGIGLVTAESTVALAVESTEGTYTAPSAATDYIEVIEDGLEFNKTRELLERNNLSSTVESEAARVGITEATASLGVELRASATEGDAPQSLDVLLRSLLGGKRQITSDQTSGTGHSTTVINFSDTSAFSVNDIVLIKDTTNGFSVRPIASIQTNTSITLAIALDNAPPDSTVVAQTTVYYSDTENAVSFSAEHNIGNQGIKQKIAGLKAVSGTVENWTVGQLPQMSFGLQGLSLEREDADASFTPDFTADALPPVTLSACAWLGGTEMSYTELGLSIENTVSYIQDACSASGRIGNRITNQVTNVNFSPYMLDNDLTKTWDVFNDNSNTSFFAYAYNPTSTAGQFNEIVAIWIPQAKIIESPVSDIDGIAGEAVTLRAHRSSGNDSVFLGMI